MLWIIEIVILRNFVSLVVKCIDMDNGNENKISLIMVKNQKLMKTDKQKEMEQSNK